MILSIACAFILFQSERPLTADLSPFAEQPQAIFMRVRPHRIRDGHGYMYLSAHICTAYDMRAGDTIIPHSLAQGATESGA